MVVLVAIDLSLFGCLIDLLVLLLLDVEVVLVKDVVDLLAVGVDV